MSHTEGPLLVPIPDSCRQLGDISRTTLYKLVDEDQLDLVHIGRRSFVTAASIVAYVDRLAAAMTPAGGAS